MDILAHNGIHHQVHLGYTKYIFGVSYKYIVLYIDNLLFEHLRLVKLILSLKFEFKRYYSKSNCFLNNLYVMHIDELERSMYHFLMCYILNPFVNDRFSFTFINTILIQPDIRQTTDYQVYISLCLAIVFYIHH